MVYLLIDKFVCAIMKVMEDNMKKEELLNLVIKDIPLVNDNNVFGITFFAPPGAGKSTVAKILNEKTGLYVTANDKIRRIAESIGIDVNENRQLIEEVANDRTVYMLKNGTSMIIDANMQFFWQKAQENFTNHNANLFFVKIDCSEDSIIKRIENRALNFENNKENYSRALVEDYYKYKEKSEQKPIPEELVYFTINTDTTIENIENQVDELIKKLNNRG